MNICGTDITVKRRLVRITRLDGDKYKFTDEPEPVIAGLLNSPQADRAFHVHAEIAQELAGKRLVHGVRQSHVPIRFDVRGLVDGASGVQGVEQRQANGE
jgi:hypothetical protein